MEKLHTELEKVDDLLELNYMHFNNIFILKQLIVDDKLKEYIDVNDKSSFVKGKRNVTDFLNKTLSDLGEEFEDFKQKPKIAKKHFKTIKEKYGLKVFRNKEEIESFKNKLRLELKILSAVEFLEIQNKELKKARKTISKQIDEERDILVRSLMEEIDRDSDKENSNNIYNSTFDTIQNKINTLQRRDSESSIGSGWISTDGKYIGKKPRFYFR